MTERRENDRRRVYLGGLVETAAFLPAISCILRDVSLEGARIALAPDAALPGRVMLHVPSRGESRPARVVWRAAGAAGLRFEAGDPSADCDELRRRLRDSEAEVARLRDALVSHEPRRGDPLH